MLVSATYTSLEIHYGVAGVIFSAVLVALDPDFDAPDVNTEQYWVMAGVCRWLVTVVLCFSDFP